MQFDSNRPARIHPGPTLAAVFASLAASVPALADCGAAGSGHCALPHETVGCSDAACCTLVCNLDPFCCDVGWDEYCAAGAVNECGMAPARLMVMAFGAFANLPGGVSAQPCDLVAFNTATATWSIYFDGDDVGLAGQIIRAATINAAGEIVIATNSGGSVAGLVGGPAGNAFEPYDLIRFTPTSLGTTTAGSWTFHFDGSDVGLSENLDRSFRGVSILADQSILVVTRGNVTLPGGVALTPNDIARFQPTSLGAVTAGTWSMHFDGSDVGLTTSGEFLDGAFARPDNTLVLSTRGAFAVAGVSGSRTDFFNFIPLTLGESTTGSFQMNLTAATMSMAGSLNPQACFEDPYEYPAGPRPGSGGGGGGGGGGSMGPASCGDTGTADCCVTSLTPYCADSACCETVCGVDPLCCAIAWDEYCVGHATQLCDPCMPDSLAVMAFGAMNNLPGGVSVSPCDLASYDLNTGAWATWFDGNDVGLVNRIIRSAAALPNGDLLISLDAGGNLPGLAGGPNGTAYEPFDLLRFTPTSLGENTAGTWSFHFDGSDVGLSVNPDMALRGISVLADGSLIMVTRGDVTLPDVGSVTANDLVKFTPTSLGATTSGTWSMYLDGSDVGLGTTTERLDGVSVQEDGRIVLSTRGTFTVSGVSGSRGDLIDFIPTAIGDATSGTFAMRLTAVQMGLPSALNPSATFLIDPVVDMDDRPMLPVLFDRLPQATVSANAVDAGHAEYLIVYQGVDPNSASTGLIDVQAVIDAIRAEYGDNPSGYGILDFENPFIDRLEAGPSDPNWQMTADTVVAALQAVKAEFPQVKWTMYSMPLIRYWLPPYYSWADATPEVREEAFTRTLIGFDPVLRACDWFNPSAYDRYELATYSDAQQASKTAQETAWREALVEVCNRFNAASGLPRKPIIPMVSPMFWRVGQISYNMKQMPLEELLRDSVRPLMNEGADGVAFWTGLSYWVRAATSAQDLGAGQQDARYAFTMDFLGGVTPADWTATALRDDLELRISQHVSTRLNEVRLEVYNLLFGAATPP